MTGYKVTSDMISRGFTKFDIISKLDDPESYGHERVRLIRACRTKSSWPTGQPVKKCRRKLHLPSRGTSCWIRFREIKRFLIIKVKCGVKRGSPGKECLIRASVALQ